VESIQDSPINQRPNSKKNIVYATLGRSWLYITSPYLDSWVDTIKCPMADHVPVDLNPMPESILSPSQGPRSWPPSVVVGPFVLYPCRTCELKPRISRPGDSACGTENVLLFNEVLSRGFHNLGWEIKVPAFSHARNSSSATRCFSGSSHRGLTKTGAALPVSMWCTTLWSGLGVAALG
jgi:hypothetical protein